MKLFTLALAALTSFTAAQDYDVTSSGFRLFLKSDNATLDGTALGACHEGAATEGLCITSVQRSSPITSGLTFYHNVSSSDAAGSINTGGILVYVLHGANFNLSSPMYLSNSDTSNIAVPIFLPSTSVPTYVRFDECGKMYIEQYVDNTATPPVFLETPAKVMNWYVCLTKWSYTYTTLAWKVGSTGEPQNPTCQKVEVERVWI